MKTENLVLRQQLTHLQDWQQQLVHDLEKDVFTHLGLYYEIKDIVIA